jgi:hypothetical protein
MEAERTRIVLVPILRARPVHSDNRQCDFNRAEVRRNVGSRDTQRQMPRRYVFGVPSYVIVLLRALVIRPMFQIPNRRRTASLARLRGSLLSPTNARRGLPYPVQEPREFMPKTS